MMPDRPDPAKEISKGLKLLSLLGGVVGCSLPGIAYWRQSAPPFLEAWSLLVTGVAAALLLYAYSKPLASKNIPRVALGFIILALVLVTVYGVLLRYTTVQHHKREEGSRYQIGFYTFDWSLKDAKYQEEILEGAGKKFTAENLMMANAGFRPGGPETVWKLWTIIFSGFLLVIVFISSFFSWTYGFAILARHLSDTNRRAATQGPRRSVRERIPESGGPHSGPDKPKRGLRPEHDPNHATTLPCDADGPKAQSMEENGPAQE